MEPGGAVPRVPPSHDYAKWAARYRETMRRKAMRRNDGRRELLKLMTAPPVQISLLEEF